MNAAGPLVYFLIFLLSECWSVLLSAEEDEHVTLHIYLFISNLYQDITFVWKNWWSYKCTSWHGWKLSDIWFVVIEFIFNILLLST